MRSVSSKSRGRAYGIKGASREIAIRTSACERRCWDLRVCRGFWRVGEMGGGDVVGGNRSWVAVIVSRVLQGRFVSLFHYLRGSIPTITGEGRFDQTLLLDLS